MSEVVVIADPPVARHEPSPERPIAVGFGYAGIHRDGVAVWSESNYIDEDCMTFADATRMALAEPGTEWTVVMDAPLWSAKWRWDGAVWAVVETGLGFA